MGEHTWRKSCLDEITTPTIRKHMDIGIKVFIIYKFRPHFQLNLPHLEPCIFSDSSCSSYTWQDLHTKPARQMVSRHQQLSDSSRFITISPGTCCPIPSLAFCLLHAHSQRLKKTIDGSLLPSYSPLVPTSSKRPLSVFSCLTSTLKEVHISFCFQLLHPWI